MAFGTRIATGSFFRKYAITRQARGRTPLTQEVASQAEHGSTVIAPEHLLKPISIMRLVAGRAGNDAFDHAVYFHVFEVHIIIAVAFKCGWVSHPRNVRIDSGRADGVIVLQIRTTFVVARHVLDTGLSAK